ncbi:pseudouridine synthase [Gulosibacter sediminis]|uniref:pseudouridine synthase n=1 Tax=Gulosibacter sediminis TaxID=1729695 RepID=UPI0024A98A0C|nr:pseudouridine synthase [Gulosibacter sediminis]
MNNYDRDRERRGERERSRQEREQERDAVRRAKHERPRGGYSLADFDDIPFQPQHRPEAAAAPREELSTEGVRLQKALANAGVASRRASENLITAGKVRVNGQRVTELGTRIDPERDEVIVNGTPVQFDQSRRYVMLNKPVGVVSTMHDDQGRPDLRQFAKQFTERVYNVGRLDGETSGLLILTNDGELANVLAHPSFGVTKTYVAKVRGKFTPGKLKQLLDGIELEDGFIKADAGHIVDRSGGGRTTLVEVTLHSGRNRIVRRMFDAVGHPVQELVRRSFGPLQLGTLKTGELRELSRDELGKLLRLAKRAARQ